MIPGVIDRASKPIGAPENWDESKGSCATLHVRVEYDQGLRFLTSAWQPTQAEIAAINAGAMIHLGISAAQHPVVRMGVGPIPHEEDPPVMPTYAKSGGPPDNWSELFVLDLDTGAEYAGHVIEVDTKAGWVKVARLDRRKRVMLDTSGNPLTDLIHGSFRLERRA